MSKCSDVAERECQLEVNLKRIAELEAKVERLEAIGMALLAADERGQGLPWQEAIAMLSKELDADKS